MKLLNSIYSKTKEKNHEIITILGIKFKISNRNCFYKEIYEEVKSLKTIINSYVDITKFPEAKGVFRTIQLNNHCILNEVDRVCRKNNIPYWLCFGSLLGAVRHKGFIPWDDDIDIGMMREDYDKFIEIFNNQTDNKFYSAELYSYQEGCFNLLKVYDTRNKDCLFVDIFPHDFYYNKLSETDKLELTKVLKSLHEKYRKKPAKFKNLYEFHNYYKSLLDKTGFHNYKKNLEINPTLYWGAEYYHYRWKNAFFDYEDIFPLKEIEFMENKYFAPNNINKVLHQIYGDYMAFPRKIQTHANINKLTTEQIIEMEENLNGEYLKAGIQ